MPKRASASLAAAWLAVVLCMGCCAAISEPEIIEMYTCRHIVERQDLLDPSEMTVTFSSQDAFAYCFVKVRVLSGSYSASMRWYAPDGTLYSQEEYSGLKAGYIWWIRGSLAIRGTPAASLPGRWRVEFKVQSGPRKSHVFNLGAQAPTPLPASTPPFTQPPSQQPSPKGPSNTVTLGDYVLRFADVIKCVSVEHRPYTSILVGNREGTRWVGLPNVLVDSGADTSLFPASVAQALGIDLDSCERKTFTSPGGGTTVAYLATVQIGITHLGGIELDVDGYILASKGSPYLFAAQVAFSPDEANKSTYLLGREDVFDHLGLSFAGDTVTIRVPLE